MQETLALLKMLDKVSRRLVQGKQFPAPMPLADYGRNAA